MGRVIQQFTSLLLYILLCMYVCDGKTLHCMAASQDFSIKTFEKMFWRHGGRGS